jgi:hypothetical protein
LRTFNLIDKLVNLSEWKWNGIAGQLTWITEVEFREAMTSSIPLLIKKVEHKTRSVRLAMAELIGKLVNHGEWQLGSIMPQLTQILKPSFVRPLQERFPPSIPYLVTTIRAFERALLS